MDILYSYYLDFLTKHCFNEAFALVSWNLFSFVLIAALLVLVVIVLVLAERKILALFTVRKGPNRVGLWGCLQTVADAIKLLFKEDIIPEKADWLLFSIAPILVFSPIMFVWGLIPFCSRFVIYDSAVGLIIFAAFLSFPVVGVLLAGYSSNNKYSLIGGIRACIQTISYDLPLFMSILSVAVLAGSLNINSIILSQSSTFGLFGWYFIPAFLGLVSFFVSMLAQMNRTPFDLPEAESELVCGYNTEYSGMKFAMFFLGEYAATFILSVFFVVLFWGGYLSPLGFYITEKLSLGYAFTQVLVCFEQFFWLMLKTIVVLFVVMWIRATLPRLRADQLTEFAWKILLPISILNFFIVCVIKYVSLGILQ